MKKQTLVRAAAGVLAVCMTAGTLVGCGSSKKAEATLFALVDGTVNFKVGKEDRRYVSIVPATEA